MNVDQSGQVSGGASGSLNAGPLNLNGNVQVDPNGQVSGGGSGSLTGSQGSLTGNFQVDPNGQMSGGASGTMNFGNGGSLTGNVNTGSGQTSGSFSASLSGQDFSFMNSIPKDGRKSDLIHLIHAMNLVTYTIQTNDFLFFGVENYFL